MSIVGDFQYQRSELQEGLYDTGGISTGSNAALDRLLEQLKSTPKDKLSSVDSWFLQNPEKLKEYIASYNPTLTGGKRITPDRMFSPEEFAAGNDWAGGTPGLGDRFKQYEATGRASQTSDWGDILPLAGMLFGGVAGLEALSGISGGLGEALGFSGAGTSTAATTGATEATTSGLTGTFNAIAPSYGTTAAGITSGTDLLGTGLADLSAGSGVYGAGAGAVGGALGSGTYGLGTAELAGMGAVDAAGMSAASQRVLSHIAQLLGLSSNTEAASAVSNNPGLLSSVASTLGLTPSDIAGLGGILSGVSQLSNAKDASNLSNAALNPEDPLKASRAGYADQLQKLMADPSSITSNPGYQFQYNQGLEGLRRTMAAGGYGGSGNEAIAAEKYGQDYASNAYQQQVQTLSTLAGYGFAPQTANYGAAVSATNSANQTQQNAYGQIGAGLSNLVGISSNANNQSSISQLGTMLAKLG
jgi:hypothetical protein